MVMINGDTIVKKQFEILDKDGVISFELGKLTLAVRKEDLKKYLQEVQKMQYIKEDIENMLKDHLKNQAKLTEIQLKKEEYDKRRISKFNRKYF